MDKLSRSASHQISLLQPSTLHINTRCLLLILASHLIHLSLSHLDWVRVYGPLSLQTCKRKTVFSSCYIDQIWLKFQEADFDQRWPCLTSVLWGRLMFGQAVVLGTKNEVVWPLCWPALIALFQVVALTFVDQIWLVIFRLFWVALSCCWRSSWLRLTELFWRSILALLPSIDFLVRASCFCCFD